jgi:hypothetical protein
MTCTTAQQHYTQMLQIKFLPNWRIYLKSADRNSPISLSKMWLPMHQFSQNSQTFNKFLWRDCVLNFSKLHTNYRICKQNFIHAFNWSIVFSAPIFIKFTITPQSCVQIFYPEWKRKMETMGRNSFMPFCKARLSMSQFLQNSHLLIVLFCTESIHQISVFWSKLEA